MARPRKSSRSAISADSPDVSIKGNVLWALEVILFFALLLPNIALALYYKWRPPKIKPVEGQVVLVTGAARGLGKELALAFAKRGCKVACVDINRESVLETAAEITRDGERARAYFTNVAKVEEIETLREAVTKDLGPVDILVNNASMVYGRRLEDMPDEVVRAMTDINFVSFVWMVRAFLPQMKSRGSGHIVTISSLSAFFPIANGSMYAACKAAITGFMESVRQEVVEEGYDGIHFTSVCPYWLDSASSALDSRQRQLSWRPEMVAHNTVIAVRRNAACISLPERGFYLGHLFKMLPTRTADWAYRLSSCSMKESQEMMERCEAAIKATVK